MKATSIHFVCSKNNKRERKKKKKKKDKKEKEKKKNVFLGLETFFQFLAFLICKRCKFGG